MSVRITDAEGKKPVFTQWEAEAGRRRLAEAELL